MTHPQEINLARLNDTELNKHIAKLRASFVAVTTGNADRERRIGKETRKLDRGRRAQREFGRLITVAQSAIDRRGQSAKTE